ncbi:MAG: hypothetical protein IOD05_17170 [Rhodobacter sp.]|nr:hypothetical protein [Rhodobacter sp.]MCA3493058.1 hypothetical protein [Rhodobacter sp.]MCA3501594.1 hypothetical protein [Rhodobacter sp.]MCA3504944.1 hypothetical protein [Rhodobacter sp.]MCA3516232.1 hypothetical protein [Rhodobacter sp.]
MANRLALVSETEIKRSVRGALAGGVQIGRVEVDHRTGRVVIIAVGTVDLFTGPNPDELLK